MKKTTRTARKVLSVFLAVLMMLTTWAVAVPGLVLAADGNKYYVKVYVNIYDGSDGYAGAYTVDTATGKPANYSWATNDGWYGRINMTGFTVFGEGRDYDAQDVSAELVEAESLGTYYAMSGLSDNNANGDWDSKAIAQKVYTFTLDSFPVEVFWMNDENNWDGGNTGFAIRKLTVATSEGGTEHTMWEGLAGSDSETYNYYGSITPTGIHTCFEDYAKNYDMDDYKFYKAITTSSQRAWSDPYSAGTAGTYYLNDYQSGGVSATFSEGVDSVAYNVDYINTGSTDTYHMNFINHSKTQSATIVGVNNSDKFVNNPAGTVIPAGEVAHFELKNISSLGGDGGVANFCFNYTLDNVYASDALDASLAQFYQPCYIGTWNASDDSKHISDENGDGNTGFSLYKADNYWGGDNSMTIVNTFQTTEGILERNSATSGDGTDNATFNYNYYIDTTGISNWSQTGLRFHVKESQYYTLSFQPADYTNECGTITMGGTFANPNEASITIADIAYSSVTEEFQYNHDQASGFYTYADYYTTGTPMWNVTQADNNASFYYNSEGWFRFAGNMIKGSGNSAATINFSNMTYRDRQNGSKVYFSGTINVYAFDKTALRDYVRETLLDFAPMEDRYDAVKFSAYETALSNAMRVLANQKTTQSEIDTALAELKSAVAALQSNDNLINQIDSLTHIQYVDGIGSEIANQTAKRYVLIPLGEHVVPQKAEYIGNGTFRDATNKKSNLVTNYTKDDTEIDYLNYYYWNIDYSQIDGTIALVDEALENFDSDTYSSTLKTALENAKEQLEAIDQTTTGDNTPTSQEDVDNVIKAATDLLAHMDEGYEHCDYDANDDGENELKTKASTCSEAGYTYYKCNICGKVQKVQDLELAEHSWDAGTETIAPECGNAGVITYTCLVCGATKTEPTTEIGTHDFQISDNGDGTHISKCSKCGANEEGATAEAHTYNYTINADGTHTATCSVCNATETAAHIFVNPVLARPTQNADGTWTDGTYTSTCVCGETKTEPAVRADYSKLEEAVAELEALEENENLSDEEKAVITNALADADNLVDNLVTAEQGDIDALVKELEEIKADADEAINNKELGINNITEATSGVKVQFIDASGLGTIDSVQLGEDEGFIIRVANGNADSNITITKIQGAGIDTTGATLAPGESATYDVTAPTEAGIKEYTITYTIDGLKNADGTAVTATTKAYLYVKAEAFTPYHLMDETCGNGPATAKWEYSLEASVGDFAPVYNNKAPKAEFGNDNLVVDKDWVRPVYHKYDYEDNNCYAECTGTGDTPYVKGDAHAATYRYYIDTSLAPTWQDAGFKAVIAEGVESKYDYAAFDYIRLANNQDYLDSIQGDNKTFSVTVIPGASSNVPTKTWTATSTGDEALTVFDTSDDTDFFKETEYLFGNYLDEAQTIYTAYTNFSGSIPQKTESANMMFSYRIGYNMAEDHFLGGVQAESTTMTTHLRITSYDKAALREAVANAETAGYNSAYFDAEKYAAYENALKTAKEVLGKAETNQTEVDAATAALNTAIDDLTKAESEAKFVLTVTHSIHENADKNSTATETLYDYYLANGDVTPDYTDLTGKTINKYDDKATINVTEDKAHTYNYWYIDYSGVQEAIDAADEILKNADDYSEEYIDDVTAKKEALEDILAGESTTTEPTSQSTVDDALDAVTALTGHTCNEDVVIPAEAPTCEDDGLTAGAKCSVCGKITKAQEVDPAINHNYDIANAELIARPELVDGEWTTGEYEATCLNDESHKLPLEGVQRADYTAFDEAVAELKALATYEYFTDEVKAEILNYATQLENGTYDPDGDGTPNVPLNYVADYTYNGVTIPGEQATLNQLVSELDALAAEIEDNKTNENFIKPDYTEIIAEWEEYLTLVEQYGGEVEYATEGDSTTAAVTKDGYIKDATNTSVTNGFDYILDNAYNSDSATAADWKDKIADMTADLAAINEGILDGTLRDPNFKAYDAEVKTYNEETSTVNISADDKATVEAAMAIVDAIKANPDATAADSDATIATQTAIIKAINEKYAPCVAGTHAYADANCTEAKTCELCGATTGEANGHSWSKDPVVATLPVYDEETAKWSKGEFTYECENCNETVTIYAERADYSEYDALVKAYDDIVNDESLWASLTDETIEALSEYKGKLDAIALDYTKATADDETGITTPDGQKELDALLEGLDLEIAAIQKSIEDGSGRMLDFTEFEKAVTEYEGDPEDPADSTEDIASSEDRERITNLINEIRDLTSIAPVPNAASEEQKKIDEATEEIRAIIDKYADCLAGGHVWSEWAEQVDIDADGNFEKATYTRTCEKCGKTESYEAERENYDAYDDAVAKAEELLKNEDLTDAAKETIQNALDEAKALDQNLPADIVTTDDEGNEVVIDVNNNAETIKDTTDVLNGVIDSLYDENGELKDEYKKVDYSKYDSAVGAYETLKDTMTEADKTAVEAIKAEIEAIPENGTAAQYQTQVDNAAADIAAINAKYGDCANGNHNWGAPVLTKAPTADTQGEYTETCSICGATQITKVDLADYKAFDEAVKALQDLANTENLTAEAAKAITDALAKADALDKNLPADVTTVDGKEIEGGQDKIDALVAELNGVVADTKADIADGSALAPDYEAWELAEGTYEALDKTNVKSEVIAEADALKAEIADKQADKTLTQATATQDDIDAATERLNEIIDGIEDGSLIKPADFTEVDKDLADAKEKAENNDVIDGVKEDIKEIEDKIEELRDTATADDQDEIDALEKELEDIIAGIEDGSIVKPDYEAWELAEGTYEALDKTNVKSEVIAEADDLKATIADKQADKTLTQATATQDDIDAATERLNEIIDGIEDGSLIKPADFTEVDKDLADAKEKAENNDVIDGVKEDIKEIEDKIEELRDTATADDQDDVDALEKELEDIIAGIEDGSLVKPNYTDAETAIENAENTDSLTDADKEALEDLKEALGEIENDPTSNKKDDQTAVDEIKNSVQDIINKYADCENGNHNWGAPELTKKPTADSQGEYTETCGTCGATQITKVDLADYDAFNEAVKALQNLAKTENLTAEAKAEIEEALAKADALDKNLPDDVTTVDGKEIKGGQDKIDSLVTELNGVVADTNAAITDGSALKPDYTAWEEAETAYDALDKTNVKAEIIAEADALKATIADKQADKTLTQATATQDEINDATAKLNAIITGIENGTHIKPAEYAEVEKDLADAKDKADKNDVTDGVKKDIEDIEDKLNEIKNDPTTNANDQKEIDALEKELEDIIAGIEDGTLVKPDFDGYDRSHDAYEELVTQYGDKIKDGVADDVADLDAIVEGLRADEAATKADDQTTVDDAKTQLDAIIAGINDGTLRDPDYTEVDKDLADAKNKADDSNVAAGVKDQIKEIEDKLNEIRKDPTTNANDQDDVDALEDDLEKIIEQIEAGAYSKPDYSAWNAAEADYNTLDLKNVKEEILVEVAGLKRTVNEIKADLNSTKADDQDAVDDATAKLIKIIAGINDGSLKHPDYSGVDKKLEDLKDEKNLTDATDARIDEIETAIENLKKDKTTNAKDDQDEVDALEQELDDIIAGIANGSLVKPDYTEADKAIKDAEKAIADIEEKLGDTLNDDENATLEELKEELEELKESLDELKNDPASNKKDDQAAVDSIRDDAKEIINSTKVITDKYAECLKGNHVKGALIKVVNPTCTEKGYSVYICEVCGKEIKADYIDATGHTDTDEDGTCDICGATGLYDGCACLCHNNHWFWRIVYMIIRIIWKIFGMHQVCPCGRLHY